MTGKPVVKVCHLVSGDLWAGAEVMDYCLLKGLKAFPDVDLSAIVLNQGRFAKEVRTLGIPVDVVDETRLGFPRILRAVSYTHLRAHETKANLVCRLLLEKK